MRPRDARLAHGVRRALLDLIMDPRTYRSYRDLPPIAGITSVAEAAKIGLSVETCVDRLKRHHWAFRRLHEIFIKRLIAEPIYELKMGFSLHAHYCVEHAAAWRKRLRWLIRPRAWNPRPG